MIVPPLDAVSDDRLWFGGTAIAADAQWCQLEDHRADGTPAKWTLHRPSVVDVFQYVPRLV
jgi:hypothetical protein